MPNAFDAAIRAWLAERRILAADRGQPDAPALGFRFTHPAGVFGVLIEADEGDCLLSVTLRLPPRIPSRREAEAAWLAATRSAALRLGGFEFEAAARALRWRGAALVPPDRVGPGEVEFLVQVGLAAAQELLPELTLMLRDPAAAAMRAPGAARAGATCH